jgi:hypothetical protein
MATMRLATRENGAMHIETLMIGNQSFNQFLYVPLTQARLPCRPEVHLLKDGVHEA